MLWLKEDQFLTYMKNVEGLTQADAEEKWKAALRDTSVVKNGSGASTMVPVKGIPRSEAIRGRKASRALKRSTAVSDPSDLDSLSTRLSEHAQGRSLHDPDFGNVGGSLFRAGASVSVAASSGDIFQHCHPLASAYQRTTCPSLRQILPALICPLRRVVRLRGGHWVVSAVAAAPRQSVRQRRKRHWRQSYIGGRLPRSC